MKTALQKRNNSLDPKPDSGIRPQGIPPEFIPLPPPVKPDREERSAPQPPEVLPEHEHPEVLPPQNNHSANGIFPVLRKAC